MNLTPVLHYATGALGALAAYSVSKRMRELGDEADSGHIRVRCLDARRYNRLAKGGADVRRSDFNCPLCANTSLFA
jgi:hypothetical protein